LSVPKIEERTFYPPIIEFLREIGFKAIGETTIGNKKQPDVLFQTADLKFVIEVKLGTKVGLKAVAQASDYAKRLNTENVIILFYPEKYRNQSLLDFDYIKKIALYEKVEALVLTEYWTESLEIKPSDLFKNLLSQIETRQLIEKRKVDPRTVIKLIEDYVIEMSAITYQIKTEELVGEVVNKLDLFSALGEGKIKDQETANRQVIYLASYLLFNQLLFYHIYRKKTKNDLSEIKEIEHAEDLQKYFDEIKLIDYESIYKVNILGHIPNKKDVIETLNEVIKAIRLLRAEYVTQDLAGRFFHDLIPQEVRKVLAAFYTHPIAAEILSSLAINSWDETIIDPACGSGTLLVAAYVRKKELYEKLYGFNDLKGMHKKFIEEDITGMDIMPFAAHITAINLATQNLEQETNIVRIAADDSLERSLHLRDVDNEQRLLFETVGIPIDTYTEKIRQTMLEASRQKGVSRGAVSPSGKGYKFLIKPSDTVIMNPPFTDRHKMESVYRGQLSSFKNLEGICGSSVDFWGYFVALAHLLVREGGVIGAVIPLSIARGKTSKKIRYFLINNYHIKYIIKPYDLAWSEGAAFGDLILVAEKKIPKEDDLTSIIFFKKSHRDMISEEASEIVDKIRKSKLVAGEIISREAFDILPVDKKTLEKNKDSLMYLLGGRDFRNREVLKSFTNTMSKKADKKLLYINPKDIQVGFGVDKEGLADLIFITRATEDKSRTGRAMLILDDEKEDEVVAKIKDTDIKITISREKVLPALRTITSINKLSLNGSHDFFIKGSYEGFETVYNLSKWNKKRKFDWDWVKSRMPELTHVVLVEKANPFSPNTSLLSVYSDKGIITPHVFWIFKNLNKDDSKIMSMFLNSIVFLVQYFLLKSETTGQISHILKEDLILTKVINVKELAENVKEEMIKTFAEIKDIEFPSILEQIENKFDYRIKLDTIILQALGFSKNEVNDLLPKVYDALLKEIKAGKKVV
jgi:hypothetical protein